MRFLLALIILASGVFSFADVQNKNFSGIVRLKNGHELFVDYTPAKANKPTVVLVNGLTFSTKDYFVLADILKNNGVGVFLYDAYGMGQTLLSNPMPTTPIKVDLQVAELDEVLKIKNVPAPYNLFGLSYGGGILTAYATAFPQNVKRLMMLSPYTEVIEQSKSLILNEIAATRIMYPLNTATDEELANYFIRQFVYQTYPIFEPNVLENPFKLEGISRLVQGITPYRPIDEAVHLPAKSVFMMIGDQDEYVKKPVYDAFWEKVAPEAKCSYTNVVGSFHKISSVFPSFVARWVNFVLNSDSSSCGDIQYEANPFTMDMTNNKKTFRLPDFKN